MADSFLQETICEALSLISITLSKIGFYNTDEGYALENEKQEKAKRNVDRFLGTLLPHC